MQHWLPFDERRLYRLLRVDRGTIWRHLRDDTRNLAGLAEARGWNPDELATALAEPWEGKLREPARLAVLRRRALRVLTQGHLSQHMLFHSLHQDAIPDNAPAIFGVGSRAEFAALRRSELSPLMICRLNGRSRGHAQQTATKTLTAMAELGVEGQAIPARQASGWSRASSASCRAGSSRPATTGRRRSSSRARPRPRRPTTPTTRTCRGTGARWSSRPMTRSSRGSSRRARSGLWRGSAKMPRRGRSPGRPGSECSRCTTRRSRPTAAGSRPDGGGQPQLRQALRPASSVVRTTSGTVALSA